MSIMLMAGLIAGLVVLATVIALALALRSPPADLAAVLFVVAVSSVAGFVTWQQIEQYRAEKAAGAGFNAPQAAFGVTAPAPDHPRAGS